MEDLNIFSADIILRELRREVLSMRMLERFELAEWATPPSKRNDFKEWVNYNYTHRKYSLEHDQARDTLYYIYSKFPIRYHEVERSAEAEEVRRTARKDADSYADALLYPYC
jgi:hypothetical protein